MLRYAILSVIILFSFITIPAFAHDFTDQQDWQLGGVKFLVTMDTLEPIIGEPVNISCENKGDIISTRMSAKLVVINTHNDREFTNDGDTSLTTFRTDKLIRIECWSVMNSEPFRSKLQSTLEFHPVVGKDSPDIDEDKPVTLVPKAVNQDLTPPITDDSNDSKKSNGGCSDCTPPTLAYNNEGRKLVDNGICINDTCMDGGYFHTNYPMQYTELGKTNNIILKYYENGGASNIKLVQLGIGVPEIGSPINDSQVLIEVYIDYFADDMYNPTIKEIILIDPDEIILNNTVTISLVPCMNNNDSSCLKTDFKYSYAKVPNSTILMSNAIDYDNNTVNNYFNDGLRVVDNNVIDTVESTISSYPKCTTSSTQVDRNNCQFKLIINSEIERAQAYLDSIK